MSAKRKTVTVTRKFQHNRWVKTWTWIVTISSRAHSWRLYWVRLAGPSFPESLCLLQNTSIIEQTRGALGDYDTKFLYTWHRLDIFLARPWHRLTFPQLGISQHHLLYDRFSSAALHRQPTEQMPQPIWYTNTGAWPSSCVCIIIFAYTHALRI